MHAGPPSDPISQNRRCGHKAGGCPAAALRQKNLLLASCWPELYLGASRAQCGGGSIDCCNRARRALAGQHPIPCTSHKFWGSIAAVGTTLDVLYLLNKCWL